MRPVEAFYDATVVQQWERLTRQKTEYVVTLSLFERFAPPPPARVLDLGGGPGRYSIELAARGYEVTLADISSASLAFAKAKAEGSGVRLHRVLHLSAEDLSELPDEEFDFALSLGPFYGILTEEGRNSAAQELRRVLKPGALCIAAWLCRYAWLRLMAKVAPLTPTTQSDRVREVLDTGVLRAAEGGGPLPDSYCEFPSEIAPFMEANGFETIGLFAAEGLLGVLGEHVNRLIGRSFDAWTAINTRFCGDPALLGAAEHILYLGRKPAVNCGAV